MTRKPCSRSVGTLGRGKTHRVTPGEARNASLGKGVQETLKVMETGEVWVPFPWRSFGSLGRE